VTRWTRPPRESYWSPDALTRELDLVFARRWVLVADLPTDLPQPGSFLTEEVGGEPVLLVRGDDGRIRAFLNVCRHRSAVVASGAGRAPNGLVCPYHGWRYGLDGSLLSVPLADGFEEPPCGEGVRLHEVPVETWARFAFVNITGDGPDLRTTLEGVADLLGDDALEAERTNTIDDIVDANWKVLLENALEDYHVAIAHSGSIGRHYVVDELVQHVGSTTATVTLPLRASARGTYHVDDGEVVGAAVFPNLVVTTWPNGSFSAMTWLPLTATTTRSRVWAFAPPGRQDPRSGDEGRRFLQRIQDEDYAMCRRVQAGMASRVASEGPPHHLEARQQMLFRQLAESTGATAPAS
jgi:phenylpropionate dioxygenase-like ring-hydroxylating dioxygenase large terminal subunit